MIFKVKYFNIESQKVEISYCYSTDELISYLSDLFKDKNKVLKSVNKI